MMSALYIKIFGLLTGVLGFCFVFWKIKYLFGQRRQIENEGDACRISDAIFASVVRFLKDGGKKFSVLVVVMFVFLIISQGLVCALAFAIGAVLSSLAGAFGLIVGTKSNLLTAVAARKGANEAFRAGFDGGTIVGIASFSFVLAGLSTLSLIVENADFIVNVGFGASLTVLFARAGGGIFAKASDIGADWFGKVIEKLKEDDPYSPPSHADQVGDQVNDNLGAGMDLWESDLGTIVAAFLLGAAISSTCKVYAIMITATGLLTSLLGIWVVGSINRRNKGRALSIGNLIACSLQIVLCFVTTRVLGMHPVNFFATAMAVLVGWVNSISIGYFTSSGHRPVLETAEAAYNGVPFVVLSAFRFSFWAPFVMVVPIGLAVVSIAYFYGIAGLPWAYGLSIGGVAALSVGGIVQAADVLGAIIDNASAIAEGAQMGDAVVRELGELDSVGNRFKATAKGFTLTAGAMTVASLFLAYAEAASLTGINCLSPFILVSLLIGSAVPFALSGTLIGSVYKVAQLMVNKAREQYEQIEGLRERRVLPDYGSFIDIGVDHTIKQMVSPAVLALVVPVVVMTLFGPEGTGGFLVGTAVVGVILGFWLVVMGAMLDNAKKHLENTVADIRGTPIHQAAVGGDTIGDPPKDTAGPAQNGFIIVVCYWALQLLRLFLGGKIPVIFQ